MKYIILLLVIMTIASCTKGPYTEIDTKERIIDCGSEQNGPSLDKWNEKGRNCFYNAFLECKQAKFKVVEVTVEGDPIINEFIILEKTDDDCKIKNSRDSKDTFGVMGVFENICYGLNKTLYSRVDDAKTYRLALNNCENNVTLIWI